MLSTPGAVYRALIPLPPDLSPSRSALMRLTETRVWSAVFLSMLVGWATRVFISHSTEDLGTAAVAHLIAALVPALPIAVLVMRFAFARNVALWREEAHTARLEGALLVARTAAHRLNNTLSPVAGYADLLTMTTAATRDPKLLAYAQLIAAAAGQASAEVTLLQRIVRLEQDHTGPLAILDLEASTAGTAGTTGATGTAPTTSAATH